jgi:RNA 2',3'-cyclic 3'-phosphodiesterase
MTERWRCFVAVPAGDEVRAALSAAVERWRVIPGLDGLRWSDADSWHVTLGFLGGVEPRSVPLLVERLRSAVDRHETADHRTAGVGAFPSAARARVVWHGVDDPDRGLDRLASSVRAALSLTAEGPLRPHVTLARARSIPVDVREWLRTADALVARLPVAEVRLMRSHLGGGPARYETLATLPLRVPASV